MDKPKNRVFTWHDTDEIGQYMTHAPDPNASEYTPIIVLPRRGVLVLRYLEDERDAETALAYASRVESTNPALAQRIRREVYEERTRRLHESKTRILEDVDAGTNEE